MEASGQLHAPTALSPRKDSRYPLGMRLGWPQSPRGLVPSGFATKILNNVSACVGSISCPFTYSSHPNTVHRKEIWESIACSLCYHVLSAELFSVRLLSLNGWHLMETNAYVWRKWRCCVSPFILIWRPLHLLFACLWCTHVCGASEWNPLDKNTEIERQKQILFLKLCCRNHIPVVCVCVCIF
jgi:hypothetical protein